WSSDVCSSDLTSEAIPKRHKVAMERYRMFRRTFEERRRGLDQLPNQQDVSDMLLNSAKGDRRRSQSLAQPCFIETAARSAREALTTVASLGPRSNQSEPMKLQKTSPPSSVERPIAT